MYAEASSLHVYGESMEAKSTSAVSEYWIKVDEPLWGELAPDRFLLGYALRFTFTSLCSQPQPSHKSGLVLQDIAIILSKARLGHIISLPLQCCGLLLEAC